METKEEEEEEEGRAVCCTTITTTWLSLGRHIDKLASRGKSNSELPDGLNSAAAVATYRDLQLRIGRCDAAHYASKQQGLSRCGSNVSLAVENISLVSPSRRSCAAMNALPAKAPKQKRPTRPEMKSWCGVYPNEASKCWPAITDSRTRVDLI
jgi:hypothetical protein